MIHIDSCYCEKKTFQSLLAVAREENLTIEDLARREGCGTHCGWCVAYLRCALRTGETVFSRLLPKEPLGLPVASSIDADTNRPLGSGNHLG